MRLPLRVALLALFVALAPAVSAQVGPDQIIGTWVQTSGSVRQSYSFGSDYTYTFRSGRRSGYISHSGNWSLTEEGMVAIQPETRVQARRGREQTVSAARTVFVLDILDIGDGLITIDGRRFTRG